MINRKLAGPLLALGLLYCPQIAFAQTAMEDMSLPQACTQMGHSGDMAGAGQNNAAGAMMPSNEMNKALMQAIMAMHPPMMQGAMNADPDLAFNCSMIAHHKGAIAMAKIQLQHGKDEEAKKMAQMTIDQQSKEVADMTKWVESHAKP